MRSSNMALMAMNTTEEHGHIGEQGFAISMKEQWQESQKAKLSCLLCNGKTLCFIGQTKSYIASFPVNCLSTEWGNILKPNRVATSQLLVVDLHDFFMHTNNTWGVQLQNLKRTCTRCLSVCCSRCNYPSLLPLCFPGMSSGPIQRGASATVFVNLDRRFGQEGTKGAFSSAANFA